MTRDMLDYVEYRAFVQKKNYEALKYLMEREDGVLTWINFLSQPLDKRRLD